MNFQRSENKRSKLSFMGKFEIALIALVLMLVGFSIAANATDYSVDKSASTVRWDAKKVTGKHNGTIAIANGSISASKAKITGGTLVIDMKTIVDLDLTDPGYNAKLVGHLKSKDFFCS